MTNCLVDHPVFPFGLILFGTGRDLVVSRYSEVTMFSLQLGFFYSTYLFVVDLVSSLDS